jgi:hypothetical protein
MVKGNIGLARGVLAAALLALAGCIGGKGEVSGTVTFDGKPLPGGMVTFIPANGKPESCRIGEDGSYRVANVPTGRAQIKVVTQPPVEFGKGEPFLPLGKYVQIPKRYSDPESSGFTCDVKRGKQEHNLKLDP